MVKFGYQDTISYNSLQAQHMHLKYFHFTYSLACQKIQKHKRNYSRYPNLTSTFYYQIINSMFYLENKSLQIDPYI